jgi:hypothetical protein
LSSLAHRANRSEDCPTFTEKSLAIRAQDQPTANAIEQFDAEFRFKIADLTR